VETEDARAIPTDALPAGMLGDNGTGLGFEWQALPSLEFPRSPSQLSDINESDKSDVSSRASFHKSARHGMGPGTTSHIPTPSPSVSAARRRSTPANEQPDPSSPGGGGGGRQQSPEDGRAPSSAASSAAGRTSPLQSFVHFPAGGPGSSARPRQQQLPAGVTTRPKEVAVPPSAAADPHPHPAPAPGPASALEMYRLAHRYGFSQLTQLALGHIVDTLTPQTAFPLLLATHLWPELHAAIREYALANYYAIVSEPEFRRCYTEVGEGLWEKGGDVSLLSPLTVSLRCPSLYPRLTSEQVLFEFTTNLAPNAQGGGMQ
jgi:hypothetical protein